MTSSYRPIRRPRLVADTRHEAFGVVLPDLDGPYYSELVHGLERAAAEVGQHLMLLATRQRTDVAQAVRDLATSVDGLVVAQGTVPDSVVAVAEPQAGRWSWSAGPRCRAATPWRPRTPSAPSRLTAHLLEHGRRHLVFVGDPDSAPDVAERYSGFRHAHAAAGLPLRRPPLRVPLVEGAGIQVAEEILRRRVKVDGLVCANDELALAVMRRLAENGVLVPDDLAIVGWDDVVTARYVVPGPDDGAPADPRARPAGRGPAGRARSAATPAPTRRTSCPAAWCCGRRAAAHRPPASPGRPSASGARQPPTRRRRAPRQPSDARATATRPAVDRGGRPSTGRPRP